LFPQHGLHGHPDKCSCWVNTEGPTAQKAKNHVIPYMWIIDLKQIRSNTIGHWYMLRGECIQEEWGKGRKPKTWKKKQVRQLL
jgi:hypothetical protein